LDELNTNLFEEDGKEEEEVNQIYPTTKYTLQGLQSRKEKRCESWGYVGDSGVMSQSLDCPLCEE